MSDVGKSGAGASDGPREPAEAWVDTYLRDINARLGLNHMANWSLFEPTPQFYARLDTGDDGDLQTVVLEIGLHIGLSILPQADYELSLKMSPEVAGEIRFHAGSPSHIRIPLYYVGKPHELGTILAHEVIHQRLALCNMPVCTEEEYEKITDLASFALGLGKLVLNGTVYDTVAGTGEARTLGYLSPWTKAYAYALVNRLHRVSDHEALRNLTDMAQSILTRAPPDK